MTGFYGHGRADFARCHGCRCDLCLDVVRHCDAELDGDLDEIAVELLTCGYPCWATRNEKVEAVRVLRIRGVSAERIADRLRIAQRTVDRYIAELATTTHLGRATRRPPDPLRAARFRQILRPTAADFRVAA